MGVQTESNEESTGGMNNQLNIPSFRIKQKKERFPLLFLRGRGSKSAIFRKKFALSLNLKAYSTTAAFLGLGNLAFD